MALLKCVLYTLQVLAVLFCANVFTFDSQQRRFRQQATLQLWLKVAHYGLCLPFLLLLAVLLAVMFMQLLLTALQNHLQGTAALVAVCSSLVVLLAGTRYALLVYIIHIYRKRADQLQQLLNAFASVYDQYVALFGSKLQVRWFTGVALFCQIFYIDIFLWVLWCLMPNSSVFAALYIMMGTPAVGTFASLVALLLLHALFRGATCRPKHAFWRKRLRRRRTQRLLQFYNDLLRLRDDLEKWMKPFIVLQLLAEAICFLPAFSIFGLTPYAALFFFLPLVYPLLHASLCHEMVIAQRSMGNELLTLHCEHVDEEASKLVEIFCLQKVLVDRLQNRSWRVLCLRKHFFLEFVSITLINGMFFKSIVFTSDDFISGLWLLKDRFRQ